MNKSTVIELASREAGRDMLTDLLRQGARQLIEQAGGGRIGGVYAGFSAPPAGEWSAGSGAQWAPPGA